MERSRNLIWMIATICFLFSFSVYGNNIPKTNGIDVSGNLIDNDTWTLANSPYNIVGDVGVPAGLTLTIEAGVEINYTGDFRILVFGAIQVNGTETDSVRFNGNSVEGTKYMLEIRRTNLDNSHIDYAVMKGPQGSVSLGSFSDTSGNSGTMIINDCSISHGNILIKFDTDESSGTSSSIVFDGILLTGLTVKAYSNDWAESEILVWRNGIISNCEFQNVAALFEWVEVDNVTMLNFETLITLENSKISDSRLGIRTDENLTSLFALHVRNSVLLNSSVAAEELKYDSVVHFGSYSGEEVLIYKYCCAYFGGSDQISLVNSQIGHGDVGILMSNQGNEGDQIQNCTFYGLDRAITVSFYSNPTLVVRESNFLNSETSHFENYSSTSFNAQSNFWDSDSPTVIASKIYDQNDDLELGLVDFSNFLTTPNIDAPISPPHDVVKSADGAGGLDISWSANPESDLAAYQVHYGAFDGFSFENAVNVGNVTSYNLSGVSLSDSIAVTVLDSQADGVDDLVEGHESWFGFGVSVPNSAPIMNDPTEVGLDYIAIGWSSVEGATSYLFDLSTEEDFSSFVHNASEHTGTLVYSYGLDPGQTYFARVRAKNAAGESLYSNTVEVKTLLFSEISGMNITPVRDGDLEWGDFDLDGDLDLLIAGESDGDYITEIYENQSGTFVLHSSSVDLIGLSIGDLEWADLDGDGDLDIILSGNYGSDVNSKVYLYNGGSFIESSESILQNLGNSTISHLDVDNDGDYDIVMTGYDNEGEKKAIIYENIHGLLQEMVDQPILGISAGAIATGDFDLDMDLDILISGTSEIQSQITKVYRNFSGGFEEINLSIDSKWGGLSMGDIDSDGDLDLVSTGISNNTAYESSSLYYFVNTDFQEFNQGQIDPLGSWGAVELGDIDSDGDIDILLGGTNSVLGNFLKIYENQTNDFAAKINFDDIGIFRPKAKVGDIDGDGDLDIAISGLSTNNVKTIKIYSNEGATIQEPPLAPENLSISIDANSVFFAWNKAADQLTLQDGLNYNIYIGTEPGTQNIRPAHADLETGFRRIVRRGDIQSNSWFIRDLPPGTYYWSVQAIDASYAGGSFAPEQSFTITGTELSTQTDFTSFSIPQQTAPATINTTEHTVNVTVSSGTDLTSLIPTFSLSIGATAKIGSVTQESGVTSNDFTNPVTYTVTAEDGTTTQDWVVTLIEDASTEGLVAYYPFDGNANDESGNGHHGVVNGVALTTDRFDNAGSAYSFGGDDFIQIDPVVGDLKSESMGSVNFWFRMTDVTPSSDMWLLNFGDPSSLTYLGVRVRPDGKIWLSSRLEANIYYQVETSNVEITDAEWAMMTLVQDGSTPSIYINGIFVSQEITTGSDHSIWLDALSSVNNCRVGCRLNNGLGNTDFYEGVIDDLSLYNRALSESEILALFDSNGEINVSPSISPQAFSIPENSINGIEVGTVFATDPNGDDLTFTIDSGNTDNAFTINQLNGKITVFNQSALDYETRQSFQLSVSISDGEFSSSAIITINLTDVDETVNQAPQIVEETFVIEEDIANGTIATIQASDPDGQSVSFSITSSNPSGPFSVGTANGNVMLTNSSQLDFGNTDKYNLTVQVSDGELNTSGTIIVDLNNPTLFQTVTIPDAVSDMSEVEVEVTVTDLDGIPSAWLYRKKISQQGYSNPRTVSIVNTTSTTKNLNTALLESDFDNQGSEYYFRVIDNLGNFNSSPTYYTYQVSSSNAMAVTLSGLPGSNIKNYSIISFPFADPSVEDLLEELGPYNKKNWRLFRFNSNDQSYLEYDVFNAVQPGEGYWFIQKDDINLNVGGRSVDLVDGVFSINVNEGFNIIGNPFQGTLDWAKTIQHNIDEGVISSDDIDPAYKSELYKWNSAYVSSDVLNAFEGGFVLARTDIEDFEIPVSALSNAGARYAEELPQPHNENIDTHDWRIDLFIKSPSYDYYLGGFGMNLQARDHVDDFDRFALPHFSKYLDVVFDNGEVRSIKEAADFKSWSFTIPNNLQEQKLNVSWDIPESLGRTIVLVDGVLHKIYDLSETSQVTLANQPGTTHYLFYGHKEEIYEKLDIPFDVFFAAHPNPIGESIYLKAYSHDSKELKIEIISMDGKVVFENSLTLRKGMNNYQLDLKNYSLVNGIYLFKFNDQFVTKLVKQ